MDKLAFKKKILEAGIEKQLELISDFRGSIAELKGTAKNLNETQFDSQQASYNDETNERVDLLTGQLNFAVNELHILHQIDPEEEHDEIHVGSVVHTDKRIFFVYVSLEELVVDGKDVLSPGGLRHSDEPVRHKMLDALGDIALAGYPILGHYIGHRAGHGITHGLLKSLFSDSENFEIISCDQDIVDTLPGSGVQLSEVCKVA